MKQTKATQIFRVNITDEICELIDLVMLNWKGKLFLEIAPSEGIVALCKITEEGVERVVSGKFKSACTIIVNETEYHVEVLVNANPVIILQGAV